MLNRKLICAGLSFLMILPLGACSGNADKPQTVDEDDHSDEDDSKEPTIAEPEKEEFSGETPVDNEYVTLSLSSITEDLSTDTYIWHAQLDNKSDQTVVTSIRGLSVNDFVISSPEFDGTLSAGESSTVEITFSGSDLVKNDIIEVAKASFDFYVSDEAGNTLKTESAVIYPYGEAYYQRPERVRFTEEQTIFDNEYGTLIVTGFDSYQYQYETSIYFDNKSGQPLILDITDESGYTKSFIDGEESMETNIGISYVPADQRTNTEIAMVIGEESKEATEVSFVFTLRNPEDSSIVYSESVNVIPW